LGHSEQLTCHMIMKCGVAIVEWSWR